MCDTILSNSWNTLASKSHSDILPVQVMETSESVRNSNLQKIDTNS